MFYQQNTCFQKLIICSSKSKLIQQNLLIEYHFVRKAGKPQKTTSEGRLVNVYAKHFETVHTLPWRVDDDDDLAIHWWIITSECRREQLSERVKLCISEAEQRTHTHTPITNPINDCWLGGGGGGSLNKNNQPVANVGSVWLSTTHLNGWHPCRKWWQTMEAERDHSSSSKSSRDLVFVMFKSLKVDQIHSWYKLCLTGKINCWWFSSIFSSIFLNIFF